MGGGSPGATISPLVPTGPLLSPEMQIGLGRQQTVWVWTSHGNGGEINSEMHPTDSFRQSQSPELEVSLLSWSCSLPFPRSVPLCPRGCFWGKLVLEIVSCTGCSSDKIRLLEFNYGASEEDPSCSLILKSCCLLISWKL